MANTKTDYNDKWIQAIRMSIRKRSPFFFSLIMNAHIKVVHGCGTAYTNCIDTIGFDPEFFDTLTPPEQLGVIAHELMHMVLGHAARRESRDPTIWNKACDYAENLILHENGFSLPNCALLDFEYVGKSAEEIYSILIKKEEKSGGSGEVSPMLGDMRPGEGGSGSDDQDLPITEVSIEDLKKAASGWKKKLASAMTSAKMAGKTPAGIEGEIGDLLEPKVCWKTALNQFVTTHNNDYEGYDRRFLYDGIYLDSLAGNKIKIRVAIDTSGSTYSWISQFFSELKSIIETFGSAEVEFWMFDVDAYGPFILEEFDPKNIKFIGGGGTCIRTLIEKMRTTDFDDLPLVVLTDGYLDWNVTYNGRAMVVLTPEGIRAKDVEPFTSDVVIIQ